MIHEERAGREKVRGERFMMIESSLRMWEDHKIAGIGLNWWKDNYYGEYRPEKAVEKIWRWRIICRFIFWLQPV